MKKFLIILCMMPFLMASHCNHDDDQINCTMEARAGLNITVKDATTDAILTEGVTVQASEGVYTETLENVTGSGVFSGAWERRGNYIVTVSKEGYGTYVSERIVVDADFCHVIPESRTFELLPE